MQRRRHLGLDQRMLYDWARLYGEQLGKGTDYTALRPVVSVWICEADRAAKEAALAEVDRLAAENAALRARLGPTDR